MKKEKGSLTIEASLTLFLFIFAFLFFMSFANYSAVQNKVKHCLNQTAISMSARNFQLSQLSKILKNTGVNIPTITDMIAKLNLNTNIPIYSINPYTASAHDVFENSSAVWDDQNMKREIIRFFAYYYIDLSFDASNDMSYDDVKKELEKAGLEDIEITGGNDKTTDVDGNGKLTVTNSFVKGKDLSIRIKYKIRTGLSFNSIFGFDKLEFEDSVAAKLIK